MGYIAIETTNLIRGGSIKSNGVSRNNGFWFYMGSAATIFNKKEDLEICIYKYKKEVNEIMKQHFYKKKRNYSYKRFVNSYWKFVKIQIIEVK